MNRPLESIRVLDLGISTAGPYAARFLADLGAEVIKIEPLDGENARKLGLRYGGVGYLYHVNNYNKKSIALQIQHKRGREILLDLVARSDVVIENFACGTMDKWCVGYTACRDRNPSIIYASAKGFGETGPLRERRAFDTVVQAMSGVMAVTGAPEDPPVKAGPSVCDLMTAALGAMAVTAAIAAREPGQSQFLDCAMFDMGAWSLLPLWPDALDPDGGLVERTGNRHPRHAAFGSYPCQDGSLFVTATTDAHAQSLATLLHVSDGADRGARIDASLAEWAQARGVLDAAEQLQQRGIPAAPVWDLTELRNSDLLAERGMVRTHDHPSYGAVPLVQSPIARQDFGGPGVWRDQPLLGQHTAEIIGGLLGRGEELQDLLDARVIG